jgi:hypothetical protein
VSYKTDGLLYFGTWTRARLKSVVLAADSATLTDANIPTSEALDCTGFETLLVRVDVTGGTTPTATLEALFRDPDAADGSRWVRRVNSGGTTIKTPALSVGQETEVTVDGWNSVFLRVDAVTGASGSTAWAVFARPGRRSRPRPAGARA